MDHGVLTVDDPVDAAVGVVGDGNRDPVSKRSAPCPDEGPWWRPLARRVGGDEAAGWASPGPRINGTMTALQIHVTAFRGL